MTENNHFLNVAEKKWTKEKLKEMREYISFKCPICLEQVDLKVGSQITPHFAHQKNSHCDIQIEPESEYHLNGKLQLRDWLQHQKLISNVQLEPYLRKIGQRPDLLFTYEKKNIAFEYQCSTIAPELFIKRTTMLKKINIIVKWILGAKQIKRLSRNTFRISPFQWLFAQATENQSPKIYCYCANSRSFIVLHHIIPFSSQIVFSQPKVYDANKTCLHQLLNDSIRYDDVIKEWFRKVQQFRMKPIGFMSKEIALLSKYLYEKKQIPLTIVPSYAFIPLKTAYLIKSNCYAWQTWILLYLDSLSIGACFSLNDVCYFMRNKLKKREVILSGSHISLAIYEYLMVLCILSVLKDIGHFQFKKIGPIEWTNNLFTLIDTDQMLRNKLLSVYNT